MFPTARFGPNLPRSRAGVPVWLARAVDPVTQRREVAQREVDHVDVVAHAGAVFRRVVAAVDGERRAEAWTVGIVRGL